MANHVGADDAGVRRELALLPQRLDRVDELLASGLIGGATFNAADLQVGCSVRVLLAFPQLEPLIAGRPCEAHARRVLPDAPGPIPARLPEEWVP
jgi:glutathione S-transferase